VNTPNYSNRLLRVQLFHAVSTRIVDIWTQRSFNTSVMP